MTRNVRKNILRNKKEELKGKPKKNIKNELRKDKEKYMKYQELMKKNK